MDIRIDGADVVISKLDSKQYATIREWGMMVWSRKEQALRGRATAELLDRLAQIHALPEPVRRVRRLLSQRAELMAQQRAAEDPVPLVEYPVRKKMFLHQIRGANMAMITFGFDPKTGRFTE